MGQHHGTTKEVAIYLAAMAEQGKDVATSGDSDVLGLEAGVFFARRFINGEGLRGNRLMDGFSCH